jgi:hypothetical protein
MDEKKWLVERFEDNRAHLRAVAHRMVGSLSEADDARSGRCPPSRRRGVPGQTSKVVRGASIVATQALASPERSRFAQPALVNGAPGIVVAPHGRLLVVLSLKVVHGKIVEIDVVTEPERLHDLDLAVFNG